ncbi:PorT family protein [Mucilaginibacter roseus]|uniref:PorT family protein n=1 Tax=Mucilaginibacter roseus TaxID=1528868 RepID=A0ABS8U312_9SPHI|nr:outer membrane beta-barrel protein [Mucilaginibacter roseus]MCD8740652.1 PorT family protein [Mucilaginibacter roseus]
MKIYTLLLGMLMPFSLLAQSNFKDGYIVKNTGDTIRGKIDLREWNINPEYIDFKAADDTSQRYKPANVSSFYVQPDFTYVSYSGRVSNNHNQFPNVDKERDTTTLPATVFLKELESGDRLSLYALTDNVKPRFFYKENGKQPVELNYYRYYYLDRNQEMVSQGSAILREEKFYVQQLLNLTRVHPDWGNYSLQDFEKTAFNERDLLRLVRKINGQKEIKGAHGQPAAQFYVGAGVVLARTTFRTVSSSIAFDDVSSKPGFKVAAGLNFFNNPVTRKVIFRAELAAEFLQGEAFRSALNAANQPETQVYQIKRNFISLSPQVIYNFYNANNLKINIGGGVAFSYNNYTKNGISDDAILNGSAYYATYELSKFIVMLPLQLGVIVNKKVEAAVSYTLPHRINAEQLTGVKMSTTALTLRYAFN